MTAPPTQPVHVRENPARRPGGNRAAAAAAAAGVMALLAAAVAWGAIAAGAVNRRAVDDQNGYHLRVVEQFSRQFPRPDLSDYASATGPGYHLALAVVHRFVTADVTALRAAGAAFTVALLALLGWGVARHVPWPTAVALCLPTAASLYVFAAGAWLLPDNLAWLTVLAALLIASHAKPGAASFAGACVVLAAAVFVRQINLWPLGPIVAGAALASSPPSPAEDDRLAPRLAARPGRNGALVALSGVPALLILAWFYRMWGGLTPPAFQTVGGPLPPGHSTWQHEGPNFAVPTMVLAVAAATGVFFTASAWRAVADVIATRRRQLIVVALGALVGLVAAVAVPTDFNQPAGRYSGLWNVSARFPVVAHRSVFMAALSAAGGGVLALWFLALGRRDRWLWLVTWLCFVAAQTANAKAWHKYYEPFCLMLFALAAGRVVARHGAPRGALLGPLLLAALLAGVTLWSLTPAPGG